MKSFKQALIFGILLWLIPFVVSVLIYPLRESNRALFESILPVVVALCTVFFLARYYKGLASGLLKEGVLLGIIWLAICIGIDLLLFLRGPMQMSVADYMMDIGLTYLIIPIITVGCGLLAERGP